MSVIELNLPGHQPIMLDRPRIMGVLNMTPDSFSDAGGYEGSDAAVDHALRMAAQGADIIDVGGESARPGAGRVGADEQILRVVDVIGRVRKALDGSRPEVVISIDTTLREVGEAAMDVGASILNDVSAGRDDEGMIGLAARWGAPIVLMHMQGEPATMQENPTYEDVVGEVTSFLLQRAAAARQRGVPSDQIILDPGIGFGKTTSHNLALLASLDRLVATGHPVLLGASRKRFIGQISPQTGSDPADRVGGTCASTALAVVAGVRLLRVHDVAANRQAADVAFAIHDGAKRSTSF